MFGNIKILFIALIWVPSVCLGVKSYTDHGSFLSNDKVIDSYELLPKPPTYKDTQFLSDESLFYYGRSLMNTSRWEQAKLDSDLSDDGIGSQFSSVIGVQISKNTTPILNNLFLKLRKDNDNAAELAKKNHMRIRPFVLFDVKTCEPDDEAFLRTSGSYPSGHSTNGWSMALILSEMVPEKSGNILKRGYEYGQSRVICGAHWQSDVDAGRILGAAVLSKLKSDSEFNKSFDEAKKEIRSKIFNSQ